jgi:predicted adenine nucleotide alpha hydrolase (AANH) superfamily ATPase
MPIKLLLHVCCGPCSTHVVEVLSKNHAIVGYFYNPNIFPYEEWLKRYEAFKEVTKKSNFFIDYFPKESLSAEEYQKEHQKFLEAVKNLENEPEGGKRCAVCFKLRLEETARFASSFSSPLCKGELEGVTFTTTLTIGRNKKAEIINPIGESAAQKYGVKFYAADFKKIPHQTSPFQKGGGKEGDLAGFWNSVRLSKEFGIYRQHYCGCEFSLH